MGNVSESLKMDTDPPPFLVESSEKEEIGATAGKGKRIQGRTLKKRGSSHDLVGGRKIDFAKFPTQVAIVFSLREYSRFMLNEDLYLSRKVAEGSIKKAKKSIDVTYGGGDGPILKNMISDFFFLFYENFNKLFNFTITAKVKKARKKVSWLFVPSLEDQVEDVRTATIDLVVKLLGKELKEDFGFFDIFKPFREAIDAVKLFKGKAGYSSKEYLSFLRLLSFVILLIVEAKSEYANVHLTDFLVLRKILKGSLVVGVDCFKCFQALSGFSIGWDFDTTVVSKIPECVSMFKFYSLGGIIQTFRKIELCRVRCCLAQSPLPQSFSDKVFETFVKFLGKTIFGYNHVDLILGGVAFGWTNSSLVRIRPTVIEDIHRISIRMIFGIGNAFSTKEILDDSFLVTIVSMIYRFNAFEEYTPPETVGANRDCHNFVEMVLANQKISRQLAKIKLGYTTLTIPPLEQLAGVKQLRQATRDNQFYFHPKSLFYVTAIKKIFEGEDKCYWNNEKKGEMFEKIDDAICDSELFEYESIYKSYFEGGVVPKKRKKFWNGIFSGGYNKKLKFRIMGGSDDIDDVTDDSKRLKVKHIYNTLRLLSDFCWEVFRNPDQLEKKSKKAVNTYADYLLLKGLFMTLWIRLYRSLFDLFSDKTSICKVYPRVIQYMGFSNKKKGTILGDGEVIVSYVWFRAPYVGAGLLKSEFFTSYQSVFNKIYQTPGNKGQTLLAIPNPVKSDFTSWSFSTNLDI